MGRRFLRKQRSPPRGPCASCTLVGVRISEEADVREVASLKHWRLRATVADGLIVTLGRYATAEQADADRGRFALRGEYCSLAVHSIALNRPRLRRICSSRRQVFTWALGFVTITRSPYSTRSAAVGLNLHRRGWPGRVAAMTGKSGGVTTRRNAAPGADRWTFADQPLRTRYFSRSRPCAIALTGPILALWQSRSRQTGNFG